MRKETERPLIVAFDGLHRTGKGTQCELLKTAASKAGSTSVVVRGDGTREGSGLTKGDPYSPEWQARSRRVKTPEGGTITAWNESSYLLAKELSHRVKERPDNEDLIIVDRSLISRAAFLLHRGVGMKGLRFSMEELYPPNQKIPTEDQIDLMSIVPDVLFDLQVDSPVTLLERLDENDPKYNFRARNIRGGFDPAAIASEHLPIDVETKVVRIDASEVPDVINDKVLKTLGGVALAPRLFDIV